MVGIAAGWLAVVALAGVAGCRIQKEKGPNGEDKKVQIDTPFGGIHVNTDQTTAADLGLPVYPGAKIAHDSDNDKSADVHMGFGQWELRVKVVSYSSDDSQDKVVAFYKKALGRFGDVISCQDGAPVGTPTKTGEGLACSEKGEPNVQISGNSASYGYHSTGDKGFQLRAGSKRHQHLICFKSSAPGQTRFSLVALDLPSGSDNEPSASN
jgi:hypothetical protein